MRDILETLTAEHNELSDLFEQMNATEDTDADDRKAILAEIEARLIPHAKWEELVLYPKFAERAGHDQLLQHAEAITEHRAVELAVLPDLHASDFDSRQFAGTAKVLGELLMHHAEEEEAEMFASARALFSADELAELDEAYATWKDSPVAKAITMHAGVKTSLKAVLRSPQAPG